MQCETVKITDDNQQAAEVEPVPLEQPAVTVSPTHIEQWLQKKLFTRVLPVLQDWEEALPDNVTERQYLLMFGQCLVGLERYSEAVETLLALQAISPETLDITALRAVNFLGDAFAGLKCLDEATEQWFKAAEMNPAVSIEMLTQKEASVYSHNRVALDSTTIALQTALVKVATAQFRAKNTTEFIVANSQRLNLAVDFHGMREAAVLTAEQMLTQDRFQEALVFFLRALDSGVDRCFSTTSRMKANQRQLNFVAKPPTVTTTQRALTGVNQCLAALVPNEALSTEDLAALSDAWIKAIAATYAPEVGTARSFLTLRESDFPASWRVLCDWQVAAAFLREGNFHEAKKFAGTQPKIKLPIHEYFSFIYGFACMGEGNFKDAVSHLEKAGRSTNPVLASTAQLALAESLEASFKLTKAEKAFQKLIKTSPVILHQKEAEYALHRIAVLKNMRLAPARQRIVVPLPDDRSTRGDWPLGYGINSHLLAAHNFRSDYTGGLGPRITCRFKTGSASEKGRLWVTSKSVDDAAALWNPERQTRMAANRDDHGEQHPLGAGPDLMMTCTIPEGTHFLSLYFVNDYNYYEQNRAYSITVTDAGQRLHCLTPVRNFGGGLYKRFAVQGPAKLQFHIWRNMSINVLLSGVFLDPVSLPPLPENRMNAKEIKSLAKRYESLRHAVNIANPPGLPALLKKGNMLLDSLSQTAESAPERICQDWIRSRLLHFQAMPANGARSLQLSLANYQTPDDVYNLIMESYTDKTAVLPSLSWYPPGTHELDIHWKRYYELLDAQETPPPLAQLINLAQANNWQVTTAAMQEATERFQKMRQMPPPVHLATELCIAMKTMEENRNDEACQKFDELEKAAQETGDMAVATRARQRLLALSGRMNFTPDRLIRLYNAFVTDGVNEAVSGSTALRTAHAFEKTKNFTEARIWLDKVPAVNLSEQGRKNMLKRWQIMEAQQNARERKK